MSLDSIGRVGELRLTFAQHDGSTVLTENYSRPPLQVMRPIRDEAGCLCIYLLSPTGGVLQGDRYTMAIRVGAGSHALFTTQSATKVYRMPDDCAEQDIRIEVESGAIFEFVPDAAILFADADLRQHIDVRLHPGALLILHEIVMPGRLARGECLQFRRYVNRITVRDDMGLLLYDAAEIEPAQTDFMSIGRLEAQANWGNFYLLGDVAAWNLSAAELCISQQAVFDGVLGDLSPLYRNGLAARMVSPRLENIYLAFHGLRRTIRQHIGLPDTPLRK